MLDKLRAELSRFDGLTPQQIADAIEADGVRGIRGDYQACALARWCSRRTTLDVTVSNEAATVRGTTGAVLLPAALTQFTINFDAGDYPNLTEPHEPEEVCS